MVFDEENIINVFRDYGFLCLGSVIAIIGAWNSYQEKKEENISESKSNLRNRNSFKSILIGLIVSLFGGVCNNIQQDKEKTEAKHEARENKKTSDSLSTAISKKQNEMDSLVLNQNDTLQTVSSLTHELKETQKKVIGLQDEMSKNFIGNDAVPIMYAITFPSTDRVSYWVDFYIVNFSKYPVYGLNVILSDNYGIMVYPTANSTPYLSPGKDVFTDALKNFDFYVLYPSVNKLVYTSRFSTHDSIESHNYGLQIRWGGGYVSNEYLHIKKAYGSWFPYTYQIDFEIGKTKFSKQYPPDTASHTIRMPNPNIYRF